MGEQVKRPPHEGQGEKPDTPKPSLEHIQIFRALGGERPTTEKPRGTPTTPHSPPAADKS